MSDHSLEPQNNKQSVCGDALSNGAMLEQIESSPRQGEDKLYETFEVKETDEEEERESV